MEKFGLNQKNRQIIINILAKYPEVETAIIYGSRAIGNYHRGSDIDLTLTGANLTPQILGKIALDLEASDSPYLFDLSIFHQLTHPNFIAHIERVGRLFYQRENNEINHLCK